MTTELKAKIEAVIDSKIELLSYMVENCHDLSVNEVSYINDDLDYIEVLYKNEVPDGDRQEAFREEAGPDFKLTQSAVLAILNLRISNTLNNLVNC